MLITVPPIPKISVVPAAWERIRSLSQGSRDKETGGILVGLHEGANVLIADASGPGPRAIQSSSHFLRDTEYCRKFLEEQYSNFGYDYVGEWHSHIVPLNRLSQGDLGTLVGIMCDRDYDFPSFAMLLAVIDKEQADIKAFIAFKVPNLRNGLVVAETTAEFLAKNPAAQGADRGRE